MAGLAYHVVVRALEGASGMSAQLRLALAVRHAIDGHLPYARYHAAGVVRRRLGAKAGQIEAAVRDWLDTDANPATQTMRSLTCAGNALWGYNLYNTQVDLAVRTLAGESGFARSKRSALSEIDDPEPCRTGTFAVLSDSLRQTEINAKLGAPPSFNTLAMIARRLGVERSAAAELAALFEEAGPMPIPLAAARLGCTVRALERRAREEGTTPEQIRAAARMTRATSKLASCHSLTELAFEEGFSDLAHMSRSFRRSSGLTPSQLRKAMRGAVRPEPWLQ